MYRLPMAIILSVTTPSARSMSSNRWYDGLVQVSESAPPFRHTHLFCHNFGFHLLFVFKLDINHCRDSQGCLVGDGCHCR
ncbi:hypothetical protein F4604DRAFT_1790997 [Suillus subluteus]|nr:hypothetical protein F4604DRAFT_1805057 [Suillus subluteus]KAG1860391.1 hypothetical protein F4604DRAFT_1790997 [Suillus subluteus]